MEVKQTKGDEETERSELLVLVQKMQEDFKNHNETHGDDQNINEELKEQIIIGE